MPAHFTSSGKRVAVFVEDGLELIPTVAEGIKKLNETNLPVIVVTNQSGIARGRFDEKRLAEIHARLRELLSADGAHVDDLFFCPHMPDAGCRCRKPAVGMLLDAAQRHGIDLKRSFVIGDRMMDIEMAHRVGARAALVPEPGDQYDVESEKRKSKETPDIQTSTFVEAVDWILGKVRDER